MNEWDRDNLDFIMKANDSEFIEWLNQADDEDVEYALNLIRQAKLELNEQVVELFDDVYDYTEANELIEKIKNAKPTR
jgi:hypothetical protein